MHLAHLAHGSRRRYCCDCRSRWIGSERVFSPWARLLGVLLLCAPSAMALVYMTYEIWFAPQPCPSRLAGWEEAWSGSPDGASLGGELEALAGGGAAGAYGKELRARMSLAGIHFTGQDYMRMRGSVGQAMAQGAASRPGVRKVWQQNGPPQGMLDILRRAESIVKPMGKTPAQFASEIESTDKRTLWSKYGNNFSSQQEAEAAYNEFQSRRGDIPKEWPPSAK